MISLGVPKGDIPRLQLYRGRGCATCNHTGIKGRQAIYELMPMTEKIKIAVLRGASTSEIRALCRESGVRTLRRSALLKLARGQTTVDEVYNSSVKEDSSD